MGKCIGDSGPIGQFQLDLLLAHSFPEWVPHLQLNYHTITTTCQLNLALTRSVFKFTWLRPLSHLLEQIPDAESKYHTTDKQKNATKQQCEE